MSGLCILQRQKEREGSVSNCGCDYQIAIATTSPSGLMSSREAGTCSLALSRHRLLSFARFLCRGSPLSFFIVDCEGYLPGYAAIPSRLTSPTEVRSRRTHREGIQEDPAFAPPWPLVSRTVEEVGDVVERWCIRGASNAYTRNARPRRIVYGVRDTQGFVE